LIAVILLELMESSLMQQGRLAEMALGLGWVDG
jgi:hypothetical protein